MAYHLEKLCMTGVEVAGIYGITQGAYKSEPLEIGFGALLYFIGKYSNQAYDSYSINDNVKGLASRVLQKKVSEK